MMIRQRFSQLLVSLILICSACRQQQTISATDVQLQLTASDTVVGETTLLVSAQDSGGRRIVNPGALSLRGDMSHAGMTPVLAYSETAEDGVFTVPFEWTMGGDWLVEARLRFPDGSHVAKRFEFDIRADASDDEMPGENSAVYMTIENRGAIDHVIISADSAAAEQIEFHQTVVKDDIARMEAIEALVIPAGETLELRPGGAHIMLSGLTGDLHAEGAFSLQLKCSTGDLVELNVSIANMRMNDLNDAVEFGGLVFSNRWARPAIASHMRER